MKPELRKYGFNELLLEDLCRVLKTPIDESDPITDDQEPIRPVSVEFCKRFKKPKKAWNSFIKLNIHNLRHTTIKPGYHHFICKAYNGKIITADIAKDPNRLFKHVVEHVLLGLADQILDIKMEELAEMQRQDQIKKAKVREELGLDVDLKVPDGVEMTDEMMSGIKGVLETIKQKQLTGEEATDIEFTE